VIVELSNVEKFNRIDVSTDNSALDVLCVEKKINLYSRFFFLSLSLLFFVSFFSLCILLDNLSDCMKNIKSEKKKKKEKETVLL